MPSPDDWSFNPRTRVGCDLDSAYHCPCRLVSIHAPVWGATEIGLLATATDAVSIHAPVWGATVTHGSDKFSLKVSIHAPVWGATSKTRSPRIRTRFNPRTRVGCDKSDYYKKLIIPFQSTHPCGVRLDELTYGGVTDYVSIHAPVWGATSIASAVKITFCFNPRTRVGCDFS